MAGQRRKRLETQWRMERRMGWIQMEGREGCVPELAWNVLFKVGSQVGCFGFFGEPRHVEGVFGHWSCLQKMEKVDDVVRRA